MNDTRLVHLVDDDEAIRHSASFMLRHAGFRVKTYIDGVAFLETVADAERGCILLDVQMPGMDGLEVQEALNERGVAMPVIVLTGHGDVAVAVRAMKAGATDFVEKPYAKQTLVEALTRAFERMEARRQEDVLSEEARGLIERLTARERDVLIGLVEGHTNKVIAEMLDISPRTVEIHRANLMEKMDAANLSTVLRIAFAAGFGRSAQA
ncbi:MAG: response regulator transcription factor [Hyphomonas sp.]|uniref:response regulator transcription factor n=1 Tax=Hyphomonas sp. TaxID=87 RepID=UPI0017B3293A|nr:response regulator [Hyphomonas sp.]MBA3070149.1 response regulator transcription factor [Hyphomonas sp.]MBU3922329.1 response regulator [Alphaproteobacteria bacterium]MBU4060275.1 response regulator [Alphaproteobacteria bacterium]MBU4162943.1 response regulator [Alphaproteobacteria bacterium]